MRVFFVFSALVPQITPRSASARQLRAVWDTYASRSPPPSLPSKLWRETLILWSCRAASSTGNVFCSSVPLVVRQILKPRLAAVRRISAQLPNEAFEQLCDATLSNDGDLAALQRQLNDILEDFWNHGRKHERKPVL